MHPADRRDRDETGRSFGRYQIRGVLGEGGMGRLYIAEQTGIEGFAKIVALKRILPHLADSKHFRDLFLNEARVAARLEHPNIVATYELGEVDGTYFIAMEYLPGEDLGGIVARQQDAAMPVDIAAAIAYQAASGLHYAHELRDGSGRPAGLVHRDVNPSNIHVTYYGMVKLLDFGIVKADATGNKTSPGVFKGKYAYSSPEQLLGDPLDRRTDVFSLGIVLWECLTGERLFEHTSDAATIDAVRAKTIVPPSLLRPDVPNELDEIAMRALMRDRDRRYATAEEMAQALERFITRRPQRGLAPWLEALFGPERASQKKAIAQGRDIEVALGKLAESEPVRTSNPHSSVRNNPVVPQPRALWSTTMAANTLPRTGANVPRVRSTTIEPAPGDKPGSVRPALPGSGSSPVAPLRTLPRKRNNATVALVAAGLVVVGGAAALLLRGRDVAQSVSAAQATTGALELQSDPPGGYVFIDGDPSGTTTPTVLRGLRAGRTVEVRIDKAGHEATTRKIEVTAGTSRPPVFKLKPTSGFLRLGGLPKGAAVYLDGSAVELRELIPAAVGSRRIRVEVDGDVIFSQTIDVQPGEQDVPVRKGRSP